MIVCHKIDARVTNSADPDQTASLKQSDLVLHCLLLGCFVPILEVFFGCVNQSIEISSEPPS